jgi:aminoglycoside 6-adenylyltransferase
MDQVAAGYERLIERFVAWATKQADIRAAAVIGSRVRTDHPADEWADLDIIVVVVDPAPYIANADWVGQIGSPWVTFVEPTMGGGLERRVLFEGGLDVDLALVPLAAIQHEIETGPSPDMADIFSRGFRILLDKDGLVAQLRPSEAKRPLAQPPAQAEFLNLVSDFWYHTVWTAKHLRRGELWWGKSCCDMYMKNLLRQMLEWHAHAMHGPDYDTWMRGRFLEEWADPRALQALRASFAHYEEADVWRALSVTMDLFRWLAVETAGKLNYPYPTSADVHTTELVQAFYPPALKPPP